MANNDWDAGGRYYETNRRDYEGYKAEAVQRLQFQHDFAQSSLKAGVVVNGGAIVALFTFLGHDKAVLAPDVMRATFGWFVAALVASLTAYLATYFSQAFYMQVAEFQAVRSRGAMAGMDETPANESGERRYRKLGNVALGIAIIASLGALVGFVIGSWCAIAGLGN